ncbi:unnamed protein product, partial [Staurois parvus]
MGEQILRMTPASRTGEVGLCRVHTYRMRTDTENDTQHPGQEKWDCAESIHTEWGQISRMTHPASGTGEVGLCRVHTYRMGTDIENDTRH